MEYSSVESMSEESINPSEKEKLDQLLSMRGKPFADWKEERKYLRDKWGVQGQKMELNQDDIIEPDQKESLEEK